MSSTDQLTQNASCRSCTVETLIPAPRIVILCHRKILGKNEYFCKHFKIHMCFVYFIYI